MAFTSGAGFSPPSGKGFTAAGFGKSAPDPLADVEYSGNLAADAASELSAMEVAYRDRSRAEADRFRNATDSEFWVAVCFKSREEKNRFLQLAKLAPLGDKYLDGHAVARSLGIEL